MKVRRGDVVIIDHPFSDASGSKVRPALVVQSYARNALLKETIIALISKNLKHVGTDSTQLLVEIGTPEGRLSGLLVDSVVKCGKLFTLNENLIRKKISSLGSAHLMQIAMCLKEALELQ